MTARKLSLLLLGISAITAVILPGPCPEMPQSNITFYDTGFQGIVHGLVPLDSSDTYVLGKFQVKHLNCLLLVFQSQLAEVEIVKFPLMTLGKIRYYMIGNVTIAPGGTQTFTNRIEFRQYRQEVTQSECHKVIQETFHIWTVGNAVALWRCIDHGYQFHDEGVMIAMESQSDPEARINDFESLIGQIFKEPFLSLITYFLPIEKRKCGNEILYPCPIPKPLDRRVHSMAVALVVIVAIASGAVFAYHWFKRNNSVGTMEVLY